MSGEVSPQSEKNCMRALVTSIREKLHAGASGAVFRRTSGVTDVIVVEHCEPESALEWEDGSDLKKAAQTSRYVCSDFVVHAGRDAKLGQDYEGVIVELYVNEKKVEGLTMRVCSDYSCRFEDGSLRPPAAALGRLGALLHDGHNPARFRLLGERSMFELRAAIFKWKSHDRVVVCDIDGTVTRSDVLGYGAHLLGYDYTHEGVAEVLGHMDEAGYRLLFLTARPISAASATRHLLGNIGLSARDDLGRGVGRAIGLHTSDTVLALPQGAVLTSSLRWGPALVSAMTGGPADFKTTVLLQVRRLFDGCTGGLAGGLGNQRTDETAYLSAGIPPHLVFIIDAKSQVRQGGSGGGRCGSYEDLIEQLPALFPPVHAPRTGESPSAPDGPRAAGAPSPGSLSAADLDAVFLAAGAGAGSARAASRARTAAATRHGGGDESGGDAGVARPRIRRPAQGRVGPSARSSSGSDSDGSDDRPGPPPAPRTPPLPPPPQRKPAPIGGGGAEERGGGGRRADWDEAASESSAGVPGGGRPRAASSPAHVPPPRAAGPGSSGDSGRKVGGPGGGDEGGGGKGGGGPEGGIGAGGSWGAPGGGDEIGDWL